MKRTRSSSISQEDLDYIYKFIKFDDLPFSGIKRGKYIIQESKYPYSSSHRNETVSYRVSNNLIVKNIKPRNVPPSVILSTYPYSHSQRNEWAFSSNLNVNSISRRNEPLLVILSELSYFLLRGMSQHSHFPRSYQSPVHTPLCIP